jgi:two-component system, NtrC family, nitrogen regulation sensor histidine kinase NtrY
MGDKRFRLVLIILLVLLVIAALAAEKLYFSDFEYRFRTKRFNMLIIEKEKILEECLENMKPILAWEDHHGSLSENANFSYAMENRITILEYIDDKLICWSDNDFDVPRTFNDSLDSKRIVFLQNGWFITRTIHAANEKIVGLLRVHTDYQLKNDLIKSGFDSEFRIPGGVGFSTSESASEYHVKNSNGDFLFSLIFPEKRKSTSFIYIPFVLWSAAFIIIIFLLFELVKFLIAGNRKLLAAVLVPLLFVLIYLLVLSGNKSAVISLTSLFSVQLFSLNSVVPSLGHLLVMSILLASFSYIYFRYFELRDAESTRGGRDYLLLTILLTVASLLFTACCVIFAHVVSDSNINFETYRILEINGFSLAAFSAVVLLMIVPLLYMIKVLDIIKKFRKKTIILALFTSLVVPALVFFDNPGQFLAFSVFYLIISFSVWFSGIRKAGAFNIAVIFSLLFGLYSLYVTSAYSEERRIETLKIQAVGLSTENDPEAEQLILKMWPDMKADTTLARLMDVEYFTTKDYEIIAGYLQKRYFTAYWRNFTINIFCCRNDDPINIGEGRMVSQNCFSFFEEKIASNSQKLTGTDFYFLDNQGGRSFYTGKLVFTNLKGITNGLFLELFSDINVFQPGYSELLLEKNYHGYAALRDYSFAKYINGRVVLRTGDYPYADTDADYVVADSEFRSFDSNGVKHMLYKSGNVTVMISRPMVSLSERFISFAYLFAFIFIIFNILLFIVKPPDFRRTFTMNLRHKVQFSLIGVLLFSFLLVGAVVATFTIQQYKTKQYDNLKEKVASIYLELESKIASEKHLTSDWRSINYESLNDLLIKFSNIFMTDINIYDVPGFLIATSRPEIFNRDLTSRRMNNMAMISLKDLTSSEFFQREKIGNLEFLSAYVPFYNNDNEVIAYLNLPYFRMQSVLAREISNLIVAVINFTLLLVVLTMSIAVFISGRLTSPLMMLGRGLASVELGKKSEHLTYRGSDEIGELVKQYNRMVDEIDESTRRLADSEREYAWREMARQIAHEIKNPLTPMRLNVQQLFKSWKDKAPGFDNRIEKFTDNQIEYIDNLSNIASAFSSFARMPVTNAEEVNLLGQVKSALELFRDTENVTFDVKWPEESFVNILADREQLNGIFSNLLKNAIQAIPETRKGLIEVGIEVSGDKAIVSVSDNGTGIPEELRKKMFTPNFTTKSSGMGLGLSIVKKYIESVNGRIWFESESGKGTVFYVEFPLMDAVI